MGSEESENTLFLSVVLFFAGLHPSRAWRFSITSLVSSRLAWFETVTRVFDSDKDWRWSNSRIQPNLLCFSSKCGLFFRKKGRPRFRFTVVYSVWLHGHVYKQYRKNSPSSFAGEDFWSSVVCCCFMQIAEYIGMRATQRSNMVDLFVGEQICWVHPCCGRAFRC